MRIERDFIGELELADGFPFGINTFRAMKNFGFSDERIDAELFRALISVKKACATANLKAGILEEQIANAIIEACDTIIFDIDKYIPPLHPLQGGAGTSTNMAANELIANIALINTGHDLGRYEIISPLDHVNCSQSTNDVYPTAVKIAVLRRLKALHEAVEALLSVFLAKEKEFAHILKIGRTELQDAMPLSLGQEFGAWADAISRFRWRLSKANDWVREVNIGGTMIGTSINADRNYLVFVVEALREIVQEPLALSRNLIDGTQNVDQIVEVSGLIKTGAVTIKKICSDLRLLSSGPDCGLGEIRLPALQAGSTIMPGKVNPVMLEAAEQVCITIIGGDHTIATAASEGNLELQQFMPLIAHTILRNLELFANMAEQLAKNIAGIEANTDKIASHLNHSFAVATLLSPTLGYEKTAEIIKEARATGKGIIDLIKEKKLLNDNILNKLLTPEVMASPGIPVIEE